ncbi:MAG: M56 family metallopeptidase, partial [Planctomycetota bacterium]
MTCRDFAEVLPALLAGLFLKSVILCLVAAAGHLVLFRARPAVRAAWFQSCLLALLLLPLLHGLLPPLTLKVLPPERAETASVHDAVRAGHERFLRGLNADEWAPSIALTPAGRSRLREYPLPDKGPAPSRTRDLGEPLFKAVAAPEEPRSRLAPLFSQWPSGIVLLYATGILLLFTRFAVCLGAVGRWTKGVRPVRSRRILALLARLQRRMKVRRRIALCVGADVTVPTAVGWFRPAIIVPAGLLARRNEDLLEAAIAHELAHISRGDLWCTLTDRFVLAMFWPNPLVWWGVKRMANLREFACDDLSAGLWRWPSVYADRLERIVLMTPLRGVPGVNAGMATRNCVVERIVRLAETNKRTNARPGRTRGALLLAFALLLCAAVAAVTVAPREAKAGGQDSAQGARILRASPEIFHALLSDLRPGDTLLLPDGDYGDFPALEGIEGNEEAPIVIRAEGDGAVFDGPAGSVSLNDLRWVTLEGLRIETPGERPSTIYVRRSRHLTVRGCRLRGGIRAYDCPDLVIEGNEIYESTRYGVFVASESNSAVIRDNFVHDASSAGVFLTSEDKPGADLSGVRVESNIVARCGSKGSAAFSVSG